MKNQIKELRVKIDGLAKLIKKLNPEKVAIVEGYKNSKEIEKAYDSFIFGKAWLGKMLGELGVESPYPKDGSRKTVEDIEPTADVDKTKIKTLNGDVYLFNSDIILKEWKEEKKSHIEKVDWLRQEIQKITKEVNKWYTNTQSINRGLSIARTNAYTYFCEARFWLGFELQRIKENK